MSAETPGTSPAPADADRTSGATVLAPKLVRRGSWFLLPACGALVAGAIQLAAGWVTSLDWFPFQGVFELANQFAQPWSTVLALGVGAMIGLGFAGLWAQERMSITVTPQEVAVHRGGRTRERFDAADLGSAFRDGRYLVLLSTNGSEHARYDTRLDPRQLRLVFQEQGHRWTEGDPYAASYRLWQDGDPELSLRSNALLAERQRALTRKRDSSPDTVRARLRQHGVLVRDREKRQYWRFAEVVDAPEPDGAENGTAEHSE